ncbi:cupin domain-containing protein [Rhodohalobacter sulfatireducens]|uniref:Cupin domain-containing protein n=1 Tax=Rhodohalobacter sulfatireducens TaxID=2911366 RepID=A0ABS9KFM7_9BACT|nr:cupin domain-containing protein [Rhodohalobacter sulfatireducens]MCG2589651.1 cupin domain-containing protein [Rhodohalobacter sulfatireducens]
MNFVHLTSCALLFVIFSLFIFDSSLAQTDANQPVKSTQILQTQSTWNGADLSYSVSGEEEITALKIEFAPGAETAWHRHPVASLAYIISGELEVILKDSKESKIFRKGDAFSEVINTWHYGKNIGDEPVELIVFYVGEKGIQLTELLSEPEIK